jgi:hypothetical protein
VGDSVGRCEFNGVLGGPFYRLRRQGSGRVRYGLGMVVTGVLPWPQWLWRRVSTSSGAVVTLGT